MDAEPCLEIKINRCVIRLPLRKLPQVVYIVREIKSMTRAWHEVRIIVKNDPKNYPFPRGKIHPALSRVHLLLRIFKYPKKLTKKLPSIILKGWASACLVIVEMSLLNYFFTFTESSWRIISYAKKRDRVRINIRPYLKRRWINESGKKYIFWCVLLSEMNGRWNEWAFVLWFHETGQLPCTSQSWHVYYV